MRSISAQLIQSTCFVDCMFAVLCFGCVVGPIPRASIAWRFDWALVSRALFPCLIIFMPSDIFGEHLLLRFGLLSSFSMLSGRCGFDSVRVFCLVCDSGRGLHKILAVLSVHLALLLCGELDFVLVAWLAHISCWHTRKSI